MSPLTQGLNYRSACDKDISLHDHVRTTKSQAENSTNHLLGYVGKAIFLCLTFAVLLETWHFLNYWDKCFG